MCFLPVHPEYLRAGLLDDFTLLLNGRRIYPVLGIKYRAFALFFRLEHPLDTCQGLVKRDLLWETVTVEIFRTVAEVAGKRFLHDNELVLFKRCDSDRFMRRGRCANMHNIYAIYKFGQTAEGTNPPLFGVALHLFGINSKHTHHFNVCAVDFFQGFIVKCRCKTCADNAGTNRFLIHTRYPF